MGCKVCGVGQWFDDLNVRVVVGVGNYEGFKTECLLLLLDCMGSNYGN